MTTIAYRDGVIAADTSMTIAGSVVPGRVKIAIAPDGRMIGGCGASGYCDSFRDWAMKEKGQPPKVAANSAGVIVDLDGSIRIWDNEEGDGPFTVKPPYFAIGSGMDLALGAMFAGADAQTAIRAAIAHDKATNGEVLAISRNPVI